MRTATIAFVGFMFLSVAAIAQMAPSEQLTIEPSGQASWADLLLIDSLSTRVQKQPPPFMGAPEPLDISGGPAQARNFNTPAPIVNDQDRASRGPALVDDFEALPDNLLVIPPDTHGAVGPNHLMTILNSDVRIQDKTGGIISTVSLDTFWSIIPGISTFDPKVLFDPGSGRFMAVTDANSFSATSSVLFAISSTDDPTGVWTFYQIDADSTDVNWADYPGFGVNPNWVVITNNMFSVAGGFFNGVAMWVLDKTDALAGGSILFNVFSTGSPGIVRGFGSFTLQPAATIGTDPTLYLLDNAGWTSGGIFVLGLFQLTGTPAAPIFGVVPDAAGISPGTGFFFVNNNFSFGQIDAAQLATTDRIETNDPRMLNAFARSDGITTRIYGAHSGGLPVVGVDRTASFWYELDPNLLNTTGDPIVQSGVLDGGSDTHHFFPSIAANANGDIALGMSRSDPTRFAEAAFTSRFAADPLGTMDPVTAFKLGEFTYFKDFGSGRNRWGDYSATVVDPTDDLTFWTIQEYAKVGNVWGTWWAKLGSVQGPPANDLCGGAIEVFEGVAYFGSTLLATGTDITSCGVNDNLDVWHSYIPSETGPAIISTCGDGTNFDTTVSVFLFCGVIELACNDDTCEQKSEVEMELTGGVEYFIRVSGANGETGDYELLVAPPEPTLTLVTPNGGEAWLQGTQQEIVWISTGNPGPDVEIELLKAGISQGFITASTPNSGSFFWDIPVDQDPANSYKVRVRSTTNPEIRSTTMMRFTILESAPSTLALVTPNGGESWEQGSQQEIVWTSTGSPGPDVEIELLKASVSQGFITASTPNSGSFFWDIPVDQDPANNYKVRVRSTTNPEIRATSLTRFTITGSDPASLTLVSPNGGELLDQGGHHRILWTSTGDPGANVELELLKASISQGFIAASTPNDGVFFWNIPVDQEPANNYKVRVRSTSDPAIRDTTDTRFTIVETNASSLTLVTPNGGETWEQGSQQEIVWTSTGDPGPDVEIELFKAGVSQGFITASTPNSGSFFWDIPAGQDPASSYKVRVRSTSDPTIRDTTATRFTISAAVR